MPYKRKADRERDKAKKDKLHAMRAIGDTYMHRGKTYKVWVPGQGARQPRPLDPKMRRVPSRRTILERANLKPQIRDTPAWARDKDLNEEMTALLMGGIRQRRTRKAKTDEDAMFIDEVTLDKAYTPSASYEWRTRASELAYLRGLVGQAWRSEAKHNRIVHPRTREGEQMWNCMSVQEGTYYSLVWNPHAGTIVCSCKAGTYGNPCSHAGAVLQCISGIARERVRDETGNTPGRKRDGRPEA